MATRPESSDVRNPLVAATLWIVAIALVVLLAVFAFTGAPTVAAGAAIFGRGLLWLLPVWIGLGVVAAIRTDLAGRLGLRSDPWETRRDA